MNDRQREQVGRIVTLASSSSRAVLAISLQQVYANHTKAGRLRSGSTMVASVAQMERAVRLLLTDLVSKVAGVSRTPAAFEEVASAIRRALRACEDDIKEVARIASSRTLDESSSVLVEVGQRELQKVRQDIEQRLEIERFDFESTSQSDDSPSSSPKPRTGGRPPAEFWDDMWASIAVQLYDGTLHPKTQADIERAMAEWITAHGYDAATSTVRARARRLADKLDL